MTLRSAVFRMLTRRGDSAGCSPAPTTASRDVEKSISTRLRGEGKRRQARKGGAFWVWGALRLRASAELRSRGCIAAARLRCARSRAGAPRKGVKLAKAENPRPRGSSALEQRSA